MNESISPLEISPKDEEIESYLFINNITQTKYWFLAKEECYILVEIVNKGYTSFKLDDEEYNVSYGFNYFGKIFSSELSNHTIEISPSELRNFKTLSVQPILLTQGTFNTSLESQSVIRFEAGGPISILIKPYFYYNWLFLQFDNTTLKNIQNISE